MVGHAGRLHGRLPFQEPPQRLATGAALLVAGRRPAADLGGGPLLHSNSRTNILYHYDGDSTPSYLLFWGIDATTRYGQAPQLPGNQALLLARIQDTELAGFAGRQLLADRQAAGHRRHPLLARCR